MAAGHLARIVLIFLCVMVLIITAQSRVLLVQRFKSVRENTDLRINSHRRVRRGSVDSDMEQCAVLTAPWNEATGPVDSQEKLYRIRVHSMLEGSALRTVFPEQPLFRFIRRVYRCCQMGYHCGSVKGIQGRLHHGTDLEFILSQDVLSVAVIRAEMHLHLSNPQHLKVEPLILYLDKRKLPTRYHSRSRDGFEETKLDLLFFFQALQQTVGRVQGSPSLIHMRRVGGLTRPGATVEPQEMAQALQDTEDTAWGGGETASPLLEALELGFALHCWKSGKAVPCEANEVKLQHTPFITLSYR
ncbi:uncharacterized protein si:ch211-170d8.2 [Alosa sapidissima]|uniref:uncharacterized protein si:ch211-170d8.2 n=1 Tax=Alosa sapidissima TaxID=34773 RepID=UPI001C09DDB4|nr:uncharacterized protein si:ch211-170d8.2 [Alosa sapidissima]